MNNEIIYNNVIQTYKCTKSFEVKMINNEREKERERERDGEHN